MKKRELIQQILNAGTNLSNIEIPEKFRKSRSVALAIAKTNGCFIQKVDQSIINKKIAIEMLKSNSYSYKNIPEKLFDDKDIAMLIVSKDGHLLWKMSDKLTDNIDVVREVVKNNPDAIKFASDRIKNDSKFMEEYQQIKQDVEQRKREKDEEQKQKMLAKVDEYKDKEIWWNDPSIVNYEKLNEVITDDMISRIEQKYNKRLPKGYIELVKKQNGGRLIKRYFVTDNEQVFVVDSILGISSNTSTSSSIEYKTDRLRAEMKDWGLTAANPDNIIVLGEDESGGHANYIFDYSELNEQGKPKISYFDNELDQKTLVANSFNDFISKLKIKEEVEID